MAVAAQDTVQCAFNGDQTKLSLAQGIAQGAATGALTTGDMQSQYAYSHLTDTMRRLSSMPGERVMLVISAGSNRTSNGLSALNLSR